MNTYFASTHFVYLGVNVLTFLGIRYLNDVSLTKRFLLFQTLGRPPSFSLLMRSLCNSLTEVCNNNLPTLLVFLPMYKKLIKRNVSIINIYQIKSNKNTHL